MTEESVEYLIIKNIFIVKLEDDVLAYNRNKIINELKICFRIDQYALKINITQKITQLSFHVDMQSMINVLTI